MLHLETMNVLGSLAVWLDSSIQFLSPWLQETHSWGFKTLTNKPMKIDCLADYLNLKNKDSFKCVTIVLEEYNF
jgi:hypothetical protein